MKIIKRFSILKVLTMVVTFTLLLTIIGCTQTNVDNVDVTSISISSPSTTITTHKGTIQMSATILPADATNQLVTWSVKDTTGQATINQTGLLAAEADGTVTVTAVSKADDTIKADLIVTISNQVMDNTKPLADAIIVASLNSESTMVGLEAEAFVPEVQFVLAADKTTFDAAIAVAQALVITTPLADAEVSAAVDVLVAAGVVFDAAKQNGTKVVLAIDLASANDFAIISKTGVSTTGTTVVIGNIAVSPVSASYITGFGLTMDSSNEFSVSSLVTGQIYAADYGVGTPTYLTTAIADMMIAYNDGMSRQADYTELYTGDLSGKTLSSAVYMWNNDVLINTDLTLNGSATDVVIFKISGTLNMAANTNIILTGGLKAENVFWLVADTVAIGVGSEFSGVLLSMTNVSFNTGSSINGMIYAQTSVSLDAVAVTKP